MARNPIWWCLGAILLIIVVGSNGCGRPAVSGLADSDDGKFRVVITVLGEYRHAYSDRTRKTVGILITPTAASAKPILQKEYSTTASALDWNAVWDKQSNLVITFFDYGPKITSADGAAKNLPTNNVLTLVYRFDRNEGRFVERSEK